MFWVPGATAGIYGIQNAGLAVSVGTWSSLIVISSFCWGILVFNEQVKSKFHALLASCVLIIGLVGMSIYSAPVVDEKTMISESGDYEECIDSRKVDESIDNNDSRLESINEVHNPDEDNSELEIELIPLVRSDSTNNSEKEAVSVTVKRPADFSGGKIIKRRKNNDQNEIELKPKKISDAKEEELVHFCGRFSLTKRQLGLLGAIINGVWGSNNMIPMHYAR